MRHRLTVVALLAGVLAFMVGTPASSAQSSASWDIAPEESVDLGLYFDASATVTLDPETGGTAVIQVEAAAGTGIVGLDLCTRGTRTVVSGDGIPIGCPGDANEDGGVTIPVGFACFGPTPCVFTFVPDSVYGFNLTAISPPLAAGGGDFTVTVTYTDGYPATTTTSTTTTTTVVTSSTTSTTVPGDPGPVDVDAESPVGSREALQWLAFLAAFYIGHGLTR